jgi:rubrerythrin
VSTTRRQLLGRGLGIAGAAAVPGALVLAPAAFAQEEDDQTDALERIIDLEQAAELAYSLAAERGDLSPDAKSAFELFAEHCGEHATALSEALDQLGVEPPDAQSNPAEYERLADFDPAADEKEQLEFMIALEEELIQVYQDETVAFEAEDLVRSGGQIGASHAQMWIAVKLLAEKPQQALSRLP